MPFIHNEAVRAWIYRIVFLLAVVVVGVAAITGTEPSTLIQYATGLTAIFTSLMAAANTSTEAA